MNQPQQFLKLSPSGLAAGFAAAAFVGALLRLLLWWRLAFRMPGPFGHGLYWPPGIYAHPADFGFGMLAVIAAMIIAALVGLVVAWVYNVVIGWGFRK